MPRALRIVLQLALLVPFWAAGAAATRALGLPLPGSVAGMLLLLAALHLRVVRPEWLDAGAGFLLRHLLLLFVPAAIGVVEHRELAGAAGLRALATIVASTALVMAATGGAVEWLARRRARA